MGDLAALGAGGGEGESIDLGQELLGDGQLGKLPVVLGHHHIHLGGLGRNDLCAERRFAKVHLTPISLLNGDGGHHSHDLWRTIWLSYCNTLDGLC